jgi:bleomycin hydrolase
VGPCDIFFTSSSVRLAQRTRSDPLIVGIAEDQQGHRFYKVKNSWGDKGLYKGYLYVSVPYVLYKTTAIMVNKNSIPQEVKTKLGL